VPPALDDQHLGGTIMWVFGDLAFLAGMIGVVVAWMRFEDVRTARLDARLDAEERARLAGRTGDASERAR
jgi:cytochrome c oxidase assembly factor CtaG